MSNYCDRGIHYCIHLLNILIGRISTTIGMNLWLAPQISEHWPNNTDLPTGCTLNWLIRPGTASTFTPNLGNDQACNTSDLVTSTRVKHPLIKHTRLSTSSKRGEVNEGCKYLSNLEAKKSGYEYSQYHWCPITLKFIWGSSTSSM